MKLRDKLRMFKEFGFTAGLSSMCSSALRWPMAITRWKDRCLINWLRENYSSVILEYSQNRPAPSDSMSTPVIWSIWWQGQENAPEIVKMCFAAMDRYRDGRTLNIITRHNYKEYIDLPGHIIRKVQEGTISLTHFSDILRLYLLYHYGGLWLDATMLVTGIIPEEIFRCEYFSIKTGFNPKSYAVTMGRWASFLQAAHRNNTLCKFALDFHLEYWKKQTMPIDHILIDYIFALAYEDFPECRQMLNAVPVNNIAADSLASVLNSEWDSRKFEQLTASAAFFKLTWRRKFEKFIAGRETMYGHIYSSIMKDTRP